MPDGSEGGKPTYRVLLAVREFTALWCAVALSVVGDQFARVALSLLVYDRTGSPWWTAVTYSMTFIPDLIGGPLLAGWADRLPRRRLMVGTDLTRAVLVAMMAIPGMPTGVLIALLFLTQLVATPFNAARSAVLPTMLPNDNLYALGQGLMHQTYQLGLILGFPVGALVTTGMGTSGALLLDAATFVISAALIQLFVGERDAAQAKAQRPPTTLGLLRAGWRLVMGTPSLRALLGLACVAGFYIAPESLAVPYAEQIGADTLGVGLLLAANPVGTLIGAFILTRFMSAETRLRWLAPLAIVTSLVLLPAALAPGLGMSLVLFALSGLFSAHDVITNTEYVRRVPNDQRGQAFGIANAGMRGAQGLGVLLTGALAEWVQPSDTIALASLAGIIVTILAARAWHRTLPPPDQV